LKSSSPPARSNGRSTNILAVVSTVMKYAVKAEVIDRARKIGLLRYERPEIEFWEFDEYTRLVGAAEEMGPTAAGPVLLAGEAGLRVGEEMGPSVVGR
jgi:hypothetical protein